MLDSKSNIQMDQLFLTPMDLYALQQQNLQHQQFKQHNQEQQPQHNLGFDLYGQQQQQSLQQQLSAQQMSEAAAAAAFMSASLMPTISSSSSSTMSSSSSSSSFPSIYDTQILLQQQQQQQQHQLQHQDAQRQQQHNHNLQSLQNHLLNDQQKQQHSITPMTSLAVSFSTTYAKSATTKNTYSQSQSPSTTALQLSNSYQKLQQQQQQQQQIQNQNKNFYNLHNHHHQTDSSSHQLKQLQQQQHRQLQQQHHHHHHHHNMPITTIETTRTASPTTTTTLTSAKYLNSSDTSSMTSTTATTTITANNADVGANAVSAVSLSAATTTTTTAASTVIGAHSHSHQQQQGSNTSPHKSCWCFGESVCSGIEVEIETNNNSDHFHHGDSTFHMKILVPAVASGAIIGKGGETIASLQKDTGARVKMSKSHDFYPGTTERVCLITGNVDGIMTVLDFIMDKIREKPDLTTKLIDAEAKQSQDRDKQVKILVPNSTAGMIIGKGGAFIKQIKEESGSYVQISQKPKDISLQERCITIIGDKENNKSACKMILAKIVEDPQSGTCLNVSYADVNGPVANFNPTGSPYASNQNAINSSSASLNSTLGATMSNAAAAASLLVNGTGINLSLNLGSPNPAPNLAVATQLLEHIKVAMRAAGYSETATTEVVAALGVLAKYGVLGIGVGVPQPNGAHATLGSYLGVSSLDQQTAAANAATAAAGNVFGAVGQVNLEQYAAAAAAAAAANRPTQSQLEAAAAQFDPFRHLGQAGQAATPVSLNNNSFGLTATSGSSTNAQSLGGGAGHSLSGLSKSPTPGDLGPKDTKNVEIPEVIVGAILGPNGRSLVEIQHVSGANVQISKKGIFAPGTRNRIVTITGQPNAIAKAQFLIEQKINEEETKRARQIPLTTVVN